MSVVVVVFLLLLLLKLTGRFAVHEETGRSTPTHTKWKASYRTWIDTSTCTLSTSTKTPPIQKQMEICYRWPTPPLSKKRRSPNPPTQIQGHRKKRKFATDDQTTPPTPPQPPPPPTQIHDRVTTDEVPGHTGGQGEEEIYFRGLAAIPVECVALSPPSAPPLHLRRTVVCFDCRLG